VPESPIAEACLTALNPISDDLIRLAVAFLLTTVCGGLLGFIFQRRQARYQWLRTRWEKELAEAQAVFDEVSRLLDRRLYRTRQLLWSFDRPLDARQECLKDYRTVVTEWNDNINRILAMLAIHFSVECRNTIDNEIGAEFRSIGQSLERAIRNDSKPDAPTLGEQLNQHAGRVYNFNLDLLNAIRNRRQSLNT
jgi:hypothetical protein